MMMWQEDSYQQQYWNILYKSTILWLLLSFFSIGCFLTQWLFPSMSTLPFWFLLGNTAQTSYSLLLFGCVLPLLLGYAFRQTRLIRKHWVAAYPLF
ncbi:MAG: hypothetical protein AAGJ35_14125, partial [Myxococcota bacterium]